MTAAKAEVEALLSELASGLDQEINILDRRDDQLRRFSDAIRQRDADAMGALLNEMERTQREQALADLKLQAVRKSLASRLGRKTDELRLSTLIDALPGEWSARLDCRRRQIVLLVDRLRRRNARTAALLIECARINRMVLDCLLPPQDTVETYTADGSGCRRRRRSLMDAER